jgi:hypothetical protein
MNKVSGLIFIVIGILIILWGFFGGGTIGTLLMPIIGIFLILIGISFLIKMKKWYWIVIIFVIIFIIYFLLVLFIPFY